VTWKTTACSEEAENPHISPGLGGEAIQNGKQKKKKEGNLGKGWHVGQDDKMESLKYPVNTRRNPQRTSEGRSGRSRDSLETKGGREPTPVPGKKKRT